MSVEDAFRKLHGRALTDGEAQWLAKVRDALDLRENDAFWFVLLMLEHYDGLYRQYPAQIAEETTRAIEGARRAFAEAARVEAARTERLLAEHVGKASAQVARKLADNPVRLHHVTLALASVTAFGAVCLVAGFKMATAERPWWVRGEGPASLACGVLGAPAGWMLFALLVPMAVYGIRVGWCIAVNGGADWAGKAVGWLLVSVSIGASVACAVALRRLV